MFCMECGFSTNEGKNFCTNCGYGNGIIEDKSRLKNRSLIIFGACSVFLILAIAYILISSTTKEKSILSTPPPPRKAVMPEIIKSDIKSSSNNPNEAYREGMVVIRDRNGLDVNACAEAYKSMVGMVEVAKVNINVKNNYEAAFKLPLSQIDANNEKVADATVSLGLISSAVRSGIQANGGAMLAEASVALGLNKFQSHMDNLGNVYVDNTKVCSAAMAKINSK